MAGCLVANPRPGVGKSYDRLRLDLPDDQKLTMPDELGSAGADPGVED